VSVVYGQLTREPNYSAVICASETEAIQKEGGGKKSSGPLT